MRLLLALLAVLLLARTTAHSANFTNVGGIVAIVNDAIITKLDVEAHTANAVDVLFRQFARQPAVLEQRLAGVYEEATDFLVERQLILHEFKTAGYNFPESIIEDTIEDRVKQQFRDRLTLMQTLKEQGITYETYRRRIREEIIVENMRLLNLRKEIIVSPQKIVDFYERNKTNFAVGDQVKLRMIVLNKSPDDGGATAKELSREILRKLDEGASFREMAKIYSDGPQRATEGDWGWVERSVLRKDLADVVFALNPGERSGVVDLNDSCWIVLVEDRRPAHVKPLNEVQEEIERTLRQIEATRLQKRWIGRLKDKSFVRYF